MNHRSSFQPRPSRLRYMQLAEGGTDSYITCVNNDPKPHNGSQPSSHLSPADVGSCDGFGARFEPTREEPPTNLGQKTVSTTNYQDADFIEICKQCPTSPPISPRYNTPETENDTPTTSDQSPTDWEGKEDEQPLCNPVRKHRWWFAEAVSCCEGDGPPIDIFRVKKGYLYTPVLHLKLTPKGNREHHLRFAEDAHPLPDGIYRYENGVFYQSARQARSHLSK